MMDVSIETARKMVQKALDSLGEEGEITDLYSTHSSDRWVVEVDGEYFGVYDTTRKTFVD